MADMLSHIHTVSPESLDSNKNTMCGILCGILCPNFPIVLLVPGGIILIKCNNRSNM